jgi:hypothetical protein
MKNKKGDYKYYLLASLIIGLLVLSLSLYFLFKEYFTQDDADWEICRQSLILRNSMPEKDLLAMIASGKDVLPVKCKNSVINIDYKDRERAETEIANAIGNCWYLTGKGEYQVFPGHKLEWSSDGKQSTPCIVCSRVHIAPGVIDYYSDEKNSISFQRALSSNYVDKDTNFWNFLNPPQGNKAFMYFEEWNNSGFSIDFSLVLNPLVGMTRGLPDDTKAFKFPRFFNVARGDLYVIYVEPTGAVLFSGERGIKPYMILMQQDDLNSLSELWARPGAFASGLQVCSSVESVTV